MKTHDYTKRRWGHDYGFTPVDGGQRGKMYGWGTGVEEGDFLILENRGTTTRYQVVNIDYQPNPQDMWFAEVVFAPRKT